MEKIKEIEYVIKEVDNISLYTRDIEIADAIAGMIGLMPRGFYKRSFNHSVPQEGVKLHFYFMGIYKKVVHWDKDIRGAFLLVRDGLIIDSGYTTDHDINHMSVIGDRFGSMRIHCKE